jgi:hypothetical protein
MGDTGRRRAREVFDWKVIIGQYEALWAKLSEMRQVEARNLETLAHPWPARMDPFYAFASYPTATLMPETVLALVDANLETALRRATTLRRLAMVDFATQVLPSEAEIVAVLGTLAGGRGIPVNGAEKGTDQRAKNTLELPAAALLEHIPAPRKAFVFRSLNWLLKIGILKVARSLGTKTEN